MVDISNCYKVDSEPRQESKRSGGVTIVAHSFTFNYAVYRRLEENVHCTNNVPFILPYNLHSKHFSHSSCKCQYNYNEASILDPT
jgi:hypothetical protein